MEPMNKAFQAPGLSLYLLGAVEPSSGRNVLCLARECCDTPHYGIPERDATCDVDWMNEPVVSWATSTTISCWNSVKKDVICSGDGGMLLRRI